MLSKVLLLFLGMMHVNDSCGIRACESVGLSNYAFAC